MPDGVEAPVAVVVLDPLGDGPDDVVGGVVAPLTVHAAIRPTRTATRVKELRERRTLGEA
jgi:hypothetical protein